MTFKEAVRALDGAGEYGAKRPSMTGYAVKTAEVDETTRKTIRETVEVKGRGDGSIVFDMADGSVSGLHIGDGGKLELTAEQFNAFAFADDWNVEKAAELEKARTGAGGM